MSETSDAGRGRLLYVEDDAEIAAMTVEVLSETYDVDHVDDGEDALSARADGRYDLMLVDRRLPGWTARVRRAPCARRGSRRRS